MRPPVAAASIEGQSPGKPFSGRARKEEETEMEKNTEKKRERKKIGDALMKVALGCRVEEVTEEYAMADGELRLTKRRETRKDIPPDLKAVQLLMSGEEDDCASLTDEELEAERRRLLGLLREEEGAGEKRAGQGGAKKPARRAAKRRVVKKEKT